MNDDTKIPDWITLASVRLSSRFGELATKWLFDVNGSAQERTELFACEMHKAVQEANANDIPRPNKVVVWVDDDMNTRIGVWDASGVRRPLTKAEADKVVEAAEKAVEIGEIYEKVFSKG